MFDFWLEKSLAQEVAASRVGLAITEGHLGAYKMDRPQDHNEFQANVPDASKPSAVRDSLLGQRGVI
jgi:hypothetical protein